MSEVVPVETAPESQYSEVQPEGSTETAATPAFDETTWKKRLAGKDQALTATQRERDAIKAERDALSQWKAAQEQAVGVIGVAAVDPSGAVVGLDPGVVAVSPLADQPTMLDQERYVVDHRLRAIALGQPSKFHRRHARPSSNSSAPGLGRCAIEHPKQPRYAVTACRHPRFHRPPRWGRRS